MGYDGSLKFDTEINESGFNSGISKLGSVAKGGLSAVTGAIAGVTAALGAGTVAGIKYNASIESYQTSFEVMTGSAEKAAEVIERLKKVGAETPFELPQLADTTQLLMNYGFTADEAMDKMMMLGDISQGSAEKMSRIATAYGQMSSAGKVQLEDIKQMIEAGFNPLQEISESTGESMESLYDRISSGTIAVDEITASMERSTSAGGKYFQSMEKQSKTLNGLLSTLKDNAQQLLGDVVKPITESFANDLLPAAIDAIDQLATAFQENGVDGLIEAGGSIISNLLLGITEALPGLLETASQVIVSIIENITLNLPQFLMAGANIVTTLIQGMISILPSLGEFALTLVTTLFQAIITYGPQMLTAGIQLIQNLLSGLISSAPQIIAQAGSMLNSYLSQILSALPFILSSGAQMISSLLSGLIANAPQIIAQAASMIAEFIATIVSHLPEILQAGIEMIGEVAAGIIKGVPDLLASIPGIVADIGRAFLDKDWVQIGIDIIGGIASGIVSAGKKVIDSVVGVASSALGAVKGFLGIASPSKVMRDEVGRYMAEGVGVGFEKNMPIKTMTAGMKKAIDKMKEEAASVTATIPNTAKVATRAVTNNYTDMQLDYDKIEKAQLRAMNEANKQPIMLNNRNVRRSLIEEGFVTV